MPNQQFTFDVPAPLSSNAFARSGYTFAGWATANGGRKIYDDCEMVVNLATGANAVVNLYPAWTTNSYSVCFNANGGEGTLTEQMFTYDVRQSLASNVFTCANCIFAGWATAPDGAAKYANGEEVSNLTAEDNGKVALYAVWADSRIVFDANDGKGEMKPFFLFDGSGQTLPKCTFTKNGHFFLGWALTSDGEATLFDGDNVEGIAAAPGETVTLYAVWQEERSCTGTLTIRTFIDGGDYIKIRGDAVWFEHINAALPGQHSNGCGNEATFINGEEWYPFWEGIPIGSYAETGTISDIYRLHKNTAIPCRDNLRLTLIQVACRQPVRLVESPSSVNDYTITIKFDDWWGGPDWYEIKITWNTSEAQKYAVRFDANGGEGAMLKRVYAAGDDVMLPENTFVREDCVFAGWALEPDGEIVWRDGETVSGGFEVGANETITLYARWSRGLYTVRFNANGGNGEMPDMTMPLDYPIALPSNAFTRTGYTFQGWAETSEGNVAYADKARVTNLANTSGQTATLYAKWVVNTYMVTLDRQGGSGGTASVTATYGNAMPAITVPTKTNLRFKGYFTGANGTGTQYYTASGASARSWDKTSTTTLYACWRENQAPAFATVTPNVDFIGMEIGATETFTVVATDADGDSLTTTWYLCDKADGADIFVGSVSSFAFTPMLSGDYRVKAEVSDGRATISILWDVKVFPEDVADYGELAGSDLIWFVAGTTLTICGNGPMPSYANMNPPYQGYADMVTRIAVEEGVTAVGDNAFQGFQKVTTVNLPETLTSIGIGAFADCASIDNVVIPNSVETLGEGVFSGCDAMAMLYLPQRFVDFLDDFCVPETCSVANTDVYSFVRRLYNLCLNREPDMSGCAHWSTLLTSGARNGVSVAYGFCFSAEMKNRHLSDGDFVEILYKALMGRAADAGGKAHWVDLLSKGISRVGVFRGFAESAEFSGICNSYGITRGNVDAKLLEERDKNRGVTMFVARLYTKALGRNYDAGGLNHWCATINSSSGKKATAIQMARSFFNSKEFQNRRLSNDAYVEVLYRTFLDRNPDAAGKKHWLDKMKAGTSRDSIMAGFYNSAEFNKIMAGYGIR